jgi:hypothetical protein
VVDDSSSNSMSPQSEPNLTNPATSVSGGVDVKAEQVSVGQDVVGRDKIVTVHAEPGATVIIGQQPSPQFEPSASEPSLANSAEPPGPTTPQPPLVQLSGKELGCSGPWGKVVVWWNSHSTKIKAAYIGGMFVLLAAFIELMQPIISAWVTQPSVTVVPAATLTPTLTGTPTPTPSPTPVLTPTAVVKAFTVMRGVAHDIVIPKETISVTAGESIRIRADVLTNVDRNELLFTWHTCRRGDETVVWGYGVFEMTYEAPSATASDCIRVRIEKGGALLDDSYIWATVTK